MQKTATFTVVLILAVSFALMYTVSLKEAGTQDELAHIPAGYAYVSEFDYRLNPEHPPLVKMMAGFPLLFLDVNFPTDNPAWTDALNGQWDMGAAFLYGAGNDADQIIQWARFGPMALTLILILFVYVWSRELMGPRWALLSTALTAFNPIFLSHGHYVTTDIGATLGTVVALYYFVKYLMRPTRKYLVWAGLGFGFALLMKFSVILLIPHFLLLIFIYWLVDMYRTWRQTEPSARLTKYLKSGLRFLGKTLIVFIIGFLLVYPFYFLTTINYPVERQVADTEQILITFAEGPPVPGEPCNFKRCFAEFDIWAAGNPALRPYAHYMLGVLMVIQRAAGGNTAYFLGEVDNMGSPLYFPVVYALKEPLAILALIGAGLLFGLYRIGRSLAKRQTNFTEYFHTHLPEFSMLLFVLIYIAWSLQTPLNIGVRHLMPILPFVYILTAGALKKWTKSNHVKRGVRPERSRRIKLGFIGAMLVWFFTAVGLAYPYYLSYFNEFVGTKDGWRYVVDSNYDWGQDLKLLVPFVEEHGIEKIAVHYFGAGDPEYYLGDRAVDWYSAKLDPRNEGVEWLAVSVNEIMGAVAPAAEGFDRREPENEYRWLENPQEPDFVVGTTIFVYKLN